LEKESTEFELGWVRYCRYKVGCLINFKNELDNVWVLHGFKNELVCCFCVWGLETYLVLLVKVLHQVVFVLEFEEREYSGICAGSTCDRSDRSPQLV